MKKLKPLRLDIQFFASEGDDTQDSNVDNHNDQQTSESQGGGEPDTTKTETFTSEQVDAFRKEASRQAKLDLYKQLGVNSLKDLQDKLVAREEKEGLDTHSQEKIEQQTNRIKELETELSFVTEATKHNPHDTGLLFVSVKPLLQVDPDTGEVTNMAAAIEQIKKDKPFLFASAEQSEGGGQQQTQPQHPQPGGGTPPTQLKGGDLGKSLAERFNKKMKG